MGAAGAAASFLVSTTVAGTASAAAAGAAVGVAAAVVGLVLVDVVVGVVAGIVAAVPTGVLAAGRAGNDGCAPAAGFATATAAIVALLCNVFCKSAKSSVAFFTCLLMQAGTLAMASLAIDFRLS